jgi:hypothetical protein
MNISRLFIALLIIMFATAAQCASWTNLLDSNLSQWDTYLSYPGEAMSDVVAGNKDKLAPAGLNKDNHGVFTVIRQQGVPVLKVSGEFYGAIATHQEYHNFDLRLELKWGEKKWPPRLALERDTGILYYSVGEFGVDYWHSWMLSQEFQIAEGRMGDYWSIAGAQIDIRSQRAADNKSGVFDNTGNLVAYNKDNNYCQRNADHEIPHDWNTLELICVNNQCVHIVNGSVVMALQNSRYDIHGKTVTLDRGKIQLQSEAAEVYYRDVKIRPLEKMPAAYTKYFH